MKGKVPDKETYKEAKGETGDSVRGAYGNAHGDGHG